MNVCMVYVYVCMLQHAMNRKLKIHRETSKRVKKDIIGDEITNEFVHKTFTYT